jgi:hypothetical protein
MLLTPVIGKAWSFSGAPNPCYLVIIAPDDFVDALGPLVRHKNGSGMPSHIVPLSLALQDFAGADDPERIKRAITSAHEQLAARYILLAGDASKIPARHRFVRQFDGGMKEGIDGTYNVTDNYYANLYWPGGQAAGFSDWDGNKDGKFNEQVWPSSPSSLNPDNVDGFPHVAVGRVPAHTIQDLEVYVRKVIAYERGHGLSLPLDVFTFLSDHYFPNSREHCENIAVYSGIGPQYNRVVQYFAGNFPSSEDPQTSRASWRRFGPSEEMMAFDCSKWLIHIGHANTHEWSIALSDGRRLDKSYIRSRPSQGWSVSDSRNFPVVFSGGCDSGLFLTNAPTHEYRGLDPDIAHWFWIDKDKQQINDRATGTTVRWPATVPAPNPYDFPAKSGRTFAYDWLCDSASGGAIAYFGATVVHEGGSFSVDLIARMLKAYAGGMRILGDVWVQGERTYFEENLSADDVLGSRRIFLGIQTLFGDPSLRLPSVGDRNAQTV